MMFRVPRDLGRVETVVEGLGDGGLPEATVSAVGFEDRVELGARHANNPHGDFDLGVVAPGGGCSQIRVGMDEVGGK